MTNEELINLVAVCGECSCVMCQANRDELLSRIESLSCCGNCDRWYSKTTCPFYCYFRTPFDVCEKWMHDTLTKEERMRE